MVLQPWVRLCSHTGHVDNQERGVGESAGEKQVRGKQLETQPPRKKRVNQSSFCNERGQLESKRRESAQGSIETKGIGKRTCSMGGEWPEKPKMSG